MLTLVDPHWFLVIRFVSKKSLLGKGIFGGLFNFSCAHTGREGEQVSDVVVAESSRCI